MATLDNTEEKEMDTVRSWWVSTHKVTINVLEYQGWVWDAAPFGKVFVNQRFDTMLDWLSRKHGKVNVQFISEEKL